MQSVPPIDDGATSYNEWKSIFQDKKFQDTPIGRAYIDVDDLDSHFSEKPENEQYWRKTKAGYVIDTLKNPQEIWVNDGGYVKNKNDDKNVIAMQKRVRRQKRDMSYVFIKQYTIIDKSVMRPMVQVVVVTPDNNGMLFVKSHYSEKEKIADIYVRRHGALIYP